MCSEVGAPTITSLLAAVWILMTISRFFSCVLLCAATCVFCLSVFFFKWRSALMQNRDLQWSGQLYVNTQIIKNVLYGIAWE